MFCVECGREDELVGALCRECYAKKHVTARLPDHVDVTLCSHCSSALLDGRWQDVESVREATALSVERAVVVPDGVSVSSLGLRLEEKDARNMQAEVLLQLSSKGVDVQLKLRTVVRLKRGSCTECSKMHGSYYEAVLQVRSMGKDLEKAQTSAVRSLVSERVAAMRKGSRGVFLTKVEKVKGGLDFYLSTVQAAKALARELRSRWCAEYKESSSIWGRRGGQEIHRMTFLVRLPNFGPGDIIETGADEILVRSMTSSVVHGVNVRSGKHAEVRPKDTMEGAVVCPKGSVVQAVVVSESEHEITVIDPTSMKSIELSKPPGFERKGDKVRLARTRKGVFPLSDSW